MAELIDDTLPFETHYVLTFVPGEAARIHTAGRYSESAAEALADVVFEILREHRPLSLKRLIEPMRQKAKKQHQCTSQWERRNNVRGCYRVARPDLVIGQSIVVIDDVITSGATIHECHRVLHVAGAEHVMGFALGRTVGW